MEIVDITERHVETYCKCLEDWSPEFDDAGDHKKRWYAAARENGLRVKLATDDDGKPVGMIQYIPIEHAPVTGENLYYVYCVWVHGYKQGVGNHQHRGIGTLLLKAAEDDAKALGAKGLAAWGIKLPFFMRSSWFKKQGYKKVDSDGISELLLKDFSGDAKPPSFITHATRIEGGTDTLKVTCFVNGWCPVQNIVFERAKRAAIDLGEKVEFEGIDTGDRETFLKYGISDALFIDGKLMPSGPPPSFKKIRGIMEKRLKKRRLA